MVENSHTFNSRPRTVRLKTRKYQDIHPGDIIVHLKEQEIEAHCLQRQGMDYLLTVENPHRKLELLQKGFMVVNQMRINIEDPDWKLTYVNVFGAPYELLDETVTELFQAYGTVIGSNRGHYAAHPEVENGIRHWRMLLRGPSRVCCRWGEPGCPSDMMASLVPATSVAASTTPQQNVTYTVLPRGMMPPTPLPTKQERELLHQTPLTWGKLCCGGFGSILAAQPCPVTPAPKDSGPRGLPSSRTSFHTFTHSTQHPFPRRATSEE